MGQLKIYKIVRTLFLFYFSTGFYLFSNESKFKPYFGYVKEIVHSFSEEMRAEYDLICIGSGGSMPEDVQGIDVKFIAYGSFTIEEARKAEVACIQSLLNKINTHSEIRPYLREYPFNTSRISVSISFRTKENKRPVDGSVAFVDLAKNKIFYEAAEVRKELFCPTNKLGEAPSKPIEIVDEALVPLFEESYEDAVRIVAEAKVNGVDAVASFKKASQPESKSIQPESSSSSYHKALSEYIRHLDKEIGFHGKGQHRQSR